MTPDSPILGIEEVAALANVRRATVDKWRTRGILPPPDLTISKTPAWRRETILHWLRATSRAPARQSARPFLRWVEADNSADSIVELGRTVDEHGIDVWVPLARFIRSGDDGWQAWPADHLVAQVGHDSASLFAHKHLVHWLRLKSEWGEEHPDELLPPALLEPMRGT